MISFNLKTGATYTNGTRGKTSELILSGNLMLMLFSFFFFSFFFWGGGGGGCITLRKKNKN